MGGPVGGVVGGVSGAVLGGIAGHEAQDAQTDPDEIWFGTDPASKDFGARRFQVDDGPRPFIDGQGPTPAHSNYFNPEKDKVSANNIALIVSGNSDEIQWSDLDEDNMADTADRSVQYYCSGRLRHISPSWKESCRGNP